MDQQRREFMKLAGAAAVAAAASPLVGHAQDADIGTEDRVFIANEDSNTLSVIDPRSNRVDVTINLTSFDEDPRPPFRFATGGVIPTHAAMIHKPLYHGCIGAHGVIPAPDGRMLATAGRGSSNVYFIDTVTKKVIGGVPNPAAGETTNPERLSSGVMVGREPHEPTFTRNGTELWVAVRGEDRIAIVDVPVALREVAGFAASSVRMRLPTIEGPSQVWFSADGELAFVASQKVSRLDVFKVNMGGVGRTSKPARLTTLDLSAADKPGFTPFLKTTPDGKEVWLSHKLADAVSMIDTADPFKIGGTIGLGAQARPNHLEFVENAKGRVAYVSLARVDDGGPDGVASSRIAIVDRSVAPAERKVVGTFFSRGREAHGLWTNPANNLLYIAHEQDELPGTPNAGQTVCTAFDVSDPLNPKFLAQIPLGALKLPSGELRNKKSINLVYVRPGAPAQTA